jgi:phosphoglycerate dehydrogenase-like enzyme
MRIVIPDKLDISNEDRVHLESYADISIYDDVNNDPSEIIKRISGAEIITANYIDLTKEIILATPTLKYIISPAVGYDWIDTKTASEQGIKVLNCPTFNTYAVAEHAIGLIFAVFRRITEAHLSILKGEWNTMEYIGHELRGKKLLSIGHGNIGKSVIRLADAIGMITSFADSKTTDEDLNSMIKNADVVVLCYPLNDRNKGSFNAEKIAMLSKSSILINVARGLVLDQDSLYNALKENRILGAGIDVFNKDETLTTGREDIIDIAKLPNVVATPHLAFNTYQTKERFGKELFINIDSILNNTPINVVN